MSWQSAVIITDTHAEYVDQDFVRRVRAHLRDHKPRWRYHLGDLFDLKSLRAGASEEDRAYGVRDDIDAGRKLLKWYRPHRLTWGNHDHRLWKMAANASQKLEFEFARELVSLVESECKGMRIKTTEYDVRKGWQEIAPGWLIGHGYKSNMYPAAANCKHFGSTITGHVHCFDQHRLDNLRGDRSFVVGCGCQIGMEYNRTHARRLKHEIGFAHIEFNTRSGDLMLWEIKRLESGRWLDPMRRKA